MVALRNMIREVEVSTAIRLDDRLVREAETEALLHRRSTPRQLEYWAQIGKTVAKNATGDELLYLLEGFAEVQVSPRASAPVDADEVFSAVDQAREQGVLARTVTGASVRYEASRKRPGMLNRIGADGQQQTGHFRNGEFVPAD